MFCPSISSVKLMVINYPPETSTYTAWLLTFILKSTQGVKSRHVRHSFWVVVHCLTPPDLYHYRNKRWMYQFALCFSFISHSTCVCSLSFALQCKWCWEGPSCFMTEYETHSVQSLYLRCFNHCDGKRSEQKVCGGNGFAKCVLKRRRQLSLFFNCVVFTPNNLHKSETRSP